ncbi:hypothetical protein R1flu_019645 [Riccia fluitans]|uniref:Uncharacterized protein n=1 Tax=Riccia fluitans TaxID=41844 RepID=A0ABD1ZKB1_9MARC
MTAPGIWVLAFSGFLFVSNFKFSAKPRGRNRKAPSGSRLHESAGDFATATSFQKRKCKRWSNHERPARKLRSEVLKVSAVGLEIEMEMNAPLGILDTLPPRLEDAGLEDCALPANAIQEAFRRAANAVSNISSAATGTLGRNHQYESDDKCTHNPGPTVGYWEDRCLGSLETGTLGEKESCVEQKTGGLIEEGHDLVVQGGEEIKTGKLVVGSEAGPKLGEGGCLGEKEGKDGHGPEVQESQGGPILIGAVM